MNKTHFAIVTETGNTVGVYLSFDAAYLAREKAGYAPGCYLIEKRAPQTYLHWFDVPEFARQQTSNAKEFSRAVWSAKMETEQAAAY